ncbi:MAG: PAS domain S-box protein [Deltaproteobacteria bacterium]|nr:PAS domain S-box protein [Deltaproteobacteria bacterium]
MTEELRLLIAEDSEDDAALIAREFGRAFNLVWRRTDTAGGLAEALRDAEWDIVVTDYTMPALTGIEAIGVIRAERPSLPVIIVSGVIGEDLAVAAMRAGANDFVLKGNLSRLVPAARRELREAALRRERRIAEERLRRSERKFRNLMESLPIGIAVLNMEREIIEVNHAMTDMLGYASKEELRNAPRESLYFDPRDRARLYQSLASGSSADMEMLLRRKDGGLFWASVNSAIKINEEDDSYIINIVHNITDRKLSEAALLDSEERFRRIFEQNEDAQVIMDCRTARVIDANPAAVALYGYAKEELIDKGVSLFMSERDSSKMDEMLCGAAGAGRLRLERVESLRRDGGRIIASVRGQRVQLEYSDVVYCTIRDITAQVSLQEEARVMQARLIHANKMASLGTLSSGVAHEINNPNNFILSNSSILAAAWRDASGILEAYYRDNGEFSMGGVPYTEMRRLVPELLAGISDGARRVKGIVDGLKDMARTDRDSLDGEADVNAAATAAAAILKHQIGETTDAFSLDLWPSVPRVRGSVQKIEQVLINLIMNALQALPGRCAALSVSTRYDEQGRSVRVTIADEGAGMPPEVIARVTEPFFTTRGGEGGTGLGLAISYSIVKEHGGTLEFASTPGKGTTVSIKLPAIPATPLAVRTTSR